MREWEGGREGGRESLHNEGWRDGEGASRERKPCTGKGSQLTGVGNEFASLHIIGPSLYKAAAS